jgi:hypothetical protein
MSNFKYICTGDSCCLIPNFLLEKKNTKECENFSVCFNEIDKDDSFCKDCLDLPYENKKRIVEYIEKSECSLCLKITNITVKREECKHSLCVNCFRKIFFNKSLSIPVFPYLNEKYDENINYYLDANVMRYKRDLDYWKKFQVIDHDDNKICRKCL